MKQLLADYVVTHGASKIARDLNDTFSFDPPINESTVRAWAYRKDKTPKPTLAVIRGKKVQDIVDPSRSLIQGRLDNAKVL